MLKKLKLIQLSFLSTFLFLSGSAFAQDSKFDRQVFVYEDTLDMEVFIPKKKRTELRPLLIYVHGGGFSVGTRDWGIKYCQYFAKKGWVTATITYHLTMKGQSFSCDQPVQNKINTLLTAAQNVNQATAFLLNKKEEFLIDSSRVVIVGSSAGAEAVLQAAYWKKSQENILPKEFMYGGVISMAGAILDLNWLTVDTAIPTALFHGTCDRLVPFGAAAHHYCAPDNTGFMMFFGSDAIRKKLTRINKGYYFVGSCGGGHSWASEPMSDKYIHFTDDFLRSDVMNNEERQIYIKLENQTNDCQTSIAFCD